MSETLRISATDKEGTYKELLPQLSALLESESDLIANMANFSAAFKEAFGWHWVGFYLVQGEELVLGPFQGPIACTRIAKGRGVCGTAWSENRPQLVPNVDQFPGHIACSVLTKSELVIPFTYQNEVKFVLDIDSTQLNDFDASDLEHLTQSLQCFAKHF